MGEKVKLLIKEYASGNYVEDATPDLVQATWNFRRHCGCESMMASVVRSAHGLSGFTAPIIELWLKDDDTAWQMVFSGQALGLVPMAQPSKVPVLTFQCAGYAQQMRNVEVQATWENTNVQDIVTDVIDNYVAPNTDITRHTGKTIAGADLTLTRLEWDGTAYDLITHLDEQYGGIEWGVMPFLISGTWYPAKFFFIATSATVNNHFWASDMAHVEYEYNVDRVRNYLILRGDTQEDDGDVLDTVDSDATSISNYGRRVEIIDNPVVDNPTDAAEYLARILNVMKDPYRALGFTAPGRTVADRIERNTPMGMLECHDLFSDVDERAFYINSIAYTLKQDGTFDMNVNPGEKLGVRKVFPPSQQAGSGQGGMQMVPFYGRGAYVGTRGAGIDWGRKGPTGNWYPKTWWQSEAGQQFARESGQERR